MKKIFYIKDTQANKISYYHLLAFLCALPFDQFYSELILISLLAHTLIHLKKEKLFSIEIKFFLPATLFAVNIICTIYSIDKSQAYKDWGKQLALFLFPLIFSLTAIDINKYKMPLLKGFGFVCAGVIIYFFIDAIRTIHYHHLPIKSLFSSAFNNQNFSAPLNLHATYFSMYCAIAFVAFFSQLIHSSSKLNTFYYSIFCLILLAGILQLASRSVLFSLFIIINFLIPFFLLTGRHRKKFIIFSYLLSAIVLTSFAKISTYKNRFLNSLEQDLKVDDNNIENISESRATRWECAFQLINQSPLTGYGSGSETMILQQKYFEKRLYNSFIHELNAHNEYLSMMLKFGITGCILYLFILFYGFKNALAQKDILFWSFLLIVTVVSFSENILDVNKGIFFFSFFFSFFLNASKNILTTHKKCIKKIHLHGNERALHY